MAMPPTRLFSVTDSEQLRKLLEDKRLEIQRLATTHGVRNLRLFGSVARGTADEHSDIDLLVDVEPGRSLFDLGGFLSDLRYLLGRDVDVVTERSLRERIRSRVLEEAVPL